MLGAALAGALLAAELSWRWSATRPVPPTASGESLWQWALLGLETVAVLVILLNLLMLARRPPERSGGRATAMDAPPALLLVPTYDESTALLRRTLEAARALDWPRLEILLLDDGAREPVRTLAAELGIGYRRRRDGRGGKAGNLNAALAAIPADGCGLVAVLDADCAPDPDFLVRLVPLLDEPGVALAQAPMRATGPDPIRRGLGAPRWWPPEPAFHYGVMLPARDAWGAAACTGSGFVARRADLAAVGGFPIESLAEDALLTLKLVAAGRRVAYLPHAVATGTPPADMTALAVQRRRWAAGYGRILASRFGPFGVASVPLANRAAFLAEAGGWLASALGRLALLLVAPVYWLAGWAPLPADDAALAGLALPALVATIGFALLIGRGRWLPIAADVHGLAIASDTVRGFTVGLLGRRAGRFETTAKPEPGTDAARRAEPIGPYDVALGLLLAANAAAVLVAVTTPADPLVATTTLLALWSVLAAGLTLAARRGLGVSRPPGRNRS